MLLDTEERHTGRSHRGLHVDPRRVRPFGDGVGAFVEDLVEDLQSLVGEADLVGVGVEQQPGHLVRTVLGSLRALLAPDVARRLGHLRQQLLNLGPKRLHWPSTVEDRQGPTVVVLVVDEDPPCPAVLVVVEVPPFPAVVVVVVVGSELLGGLEGVGVLTGELISGWRAAM